MPRFLRYLRIAFSATCGIACVLLVVLWVRSYWIVDVLEKRTASQRVQVESRTGRLTFWQFNPVTLKMSPKDTKNLLDSMAIGQFYGCCPVDNGPRRPYWHQASILSFGRFGGGLDRVTFVPYWFPVLISAACTALPWIRWSRRFSLRTLLIATTLIAVVLGAVVYAMR